MSLLRKITLPEKKTRIVNPEENIKKQLKKDLAKKKLYHFQYAETENSIILFDGLQNKIKEYKKLNNDAGNIQLLREIRQDALRKFLKEVPSKYQRAVGGFTFD